MGIGMSREFQAVRAEALEESATVTWRDMKFEVAPPSRWIMRFQHFADRDKVTLALEQALGAEQYERFMFADPAPTLADAEGLTLAITSAFGLDQGEV